MKFEEAINLMLFYPSFFLIITGDNESKLAKHCIGLSLLLFQKLYGLFDKQAKLGLATRRSFF